MGTERFIRTCSDTGIDGLILTDLPFEEKEEFLPFCNKYGVDLVSMIAPASESRIAMIAKEAEGFLYIVSGPEMTDTKSDIRTGPAAMIEVVRKNTDVPCAIGFDISTPDSSDGFIVESAIVKLLEKYGKKAPAHIGAYVKSIKEVMR